LVENLVDVLSQPDVAGRGRLLLALFGAAMAGHTMGLDFEGTLLMGGRPFFGLDPAHPEEAIKKIASGDMFPVVRGAKMLLEHTPLSSTGPKTNFATPRIVEREGLAAAARQPVELFEDALNTKVGQFAVPRYPRKALATAARFGREGFGPHKVPTSSGAPSVVSTTEELANLVGVKSKRQSELSRVYEESGRMVRDTERQRSNRVALLRADLSRAVARNDYEAVSGILSELTRVGQSPVTAKNALQGVSLQRFERMAKNASPRLRAKMYEVLGDQARELQSPR
jgi:hypothetical protein